MNSINQQLEKIYMESKSKTDDFMKRCDDLWIEDGESVVQYFYCTDEYINSKTKIMCVGKGTHGWGYEKEVKKSMTFMRDFIYNDISSPIFWFIHEFESIINGEKEFNKSHIFFSNIFRIICDVSSIKLLEHEHMAMEYLDKIQTLSQEIKAADPDILLFLTGPNYDRYISRIYKNVRFEQVSELYYTRELARLVHDSLPLNTFRLYHPGYANRNREHLWRDIIQEIKRIVG